MQDAYARCRHDLTQELQPLRHEVIGKTRQPCHGAAGMVEATCNPHSNGIAHKRENDRRGPDHFAGGAHCRSSVHNEYLHLELQKLPREARKPGSVAIRVALVDDQVLPFDVSEFTQPESERREVGRLARCASQVSDAPDFRRRLREYGERRDEQTAGHRTDECAPVRHWITSSARNSRDCGSVRPSAFAVLKLITSSSLLGCSIGSSLGLAPLKIRST